MRFGCNPNLNVLPVGSQLASVSCQLAGVSQLLAHVSCQLAGVSQLLAGVSQLLAGWCQLAASSRQLLAGVSCQLVSVASWCQLVASSRQLLAGWCQFWQQDLCHFLPSVSNPTGLKRRSLRKVMCCEHTKSLLNPGIGLAGLQMQAVFCRVPVTCLGGRGDGHCWVKDVACSNRTKCNYDLKQC